MTTDRRNPTDPAVLFDHTTWPRPAAGRNAPSTSRAAGDSMQQHATRLARQIWDYLKDHGPATCAEAQQALGLSHQTCSARFNELKRKGLIHDTGAKRKTPSGRAAVVWSV